MLCYHTVKPRSEVLQALPVYDAFTKNLYIIISSTFYLGYKSFSLLGINSFGPSKCARAKCNCTLFYMADFLSIFKHFLDIGVI